MSFLLTKPEFHTEEKELESNTFTRKKWSNEKGYLTAFWKMLTQCFWSLTEI